MPDSKVILDTYREDSIWTELRGYLYIGLRTLKLLQTSASFGEKKGILRENPGTAVKTKKPARMRDFFSETRHLRD